MCGINIIIDKTNTLDPESILAMNKAILHRGPDHSGYEKISNNGFSIYMGANRLAITDPDSHANQPFVISNENALVFNGEIYNHITLRKKLNFPFKSQSDTETLFYGLKEYSRSFISELNGMYAFAYWDQKNKSLILARDTNGTKPLYYFENDKYLIASSEIKGILASGLVKKEFNDEVLYSYLIFRYPSPPATFYKNINELLPGKCLTYASNEISISNIKPTTQKLFSTENYLLKDIEELLMKAVESQLPNFVDSGLFLSGGVDSTLLLAIINGMGVKDFPVFSVDTEIPGQNFSTSDGSFARLAAKKYNGKPTILKVESGFLNSFDDFIKTIDQPIADNSTWLTWALSGLAKKQVPVIFSGAGADEYFAGYNRHYAFYKYLNISPFGTQFLNKMAIFPEGKNSPFREKFRLANKLLKSVSNTPEKTWLNFIAINFFRTTDLPLRNKMRTESLNWQGKEHLKQALSHDRKGYLPHDVLKITDNASMQHGLEVRVPYLDTELVSFINSIPSELLLKQGPKWILKSILKNYGGNEFVKRNKEGFGLPLNYWLHKPEGKVLLDYLKPGNNPLYDYIPQPMVKQLVKEHLHKSRDHSPELYSLIILSAWLKNEFS